MIFPARKSFISKNLIQGRIVNLQEAECVSRCATRVQSLHQVRIIDHGDLLQPVQSLARLKSSSFAEFHTTLRGTRPPTPPLMRQRAKPLKQKCNYCSGNIPNLNETQQQIRTICGPQRRRRRFFTYDSQCKQVTAYQDTQALICLQNT